MALGRLTPPGSPSPRSERVHNRQPRVRGVLVRRLFLRALHCHPAGLHEDLRRPAQAPQTGQHEAEQPGFQGQPEGPAQGPQIPLPSGPPRPFPRGLALAQLGARDTGLEGLPAPGQGRDPRLGPPWSNSGVSRSRRWGGATWKKSLLGDLCLNAPSSAPRLLSPSLVLSSLWPLSPCPPSGLPSLSCTFHAPCPPLHAHLLPPSQLFPSPPPHLSFIPSPPLMHSPLCSALPERDSVGAWKDPEFWG